MAFSHFITFALLLAAPAQAPDPFDQLNPAARKRMDAVMKVMDDAAAVNRGYTEKLLTCRGMLDAMPAPTDAAAASRREFLLLEVRGGLQHFMDPESFDFVKMTDAERRKWLAAGAATAKAPDAQTRAEACGETGYQSLNHLVDIVKGTGEERSRSQKAQDDYAAMHLDTLMHHGVCSIVMDLNTYPKSGITIEEAVEAAPILKVLFFTEGTLALMGEEDWGAMRTALEKEAHKQSAKEIRDIARNCVVSLRDQAKIDALTAPVSH